VVSIELFGSRARGTARDDSDLDIFVLLIRATRNDKHALYDLAFDVGFDHRLTLSPLVGSTDTWRPDLPIARAIEQDGIPL
jgi:predicted nucleotidyltransferase